jgi:hypothetical protein
MATLEERFGRLEGAYEHLATKADLADLKADLKGDMGNLKADLKGDVGNLKAELKGDLNKVIISLAGLQLVTLGVLAAIMRLLT